MTTIRISEETKRVINELGGTFDSPDDVVQKLIHEAGHGDKLSSDSTMSNTDNVSQQGQSASESKKKFIQHLEDHPMINWVKKNSRGSWVIEVDDEKRVVYLHFYNKFDVNGLQDGSAEGFWGAGNSVTEELRDIGNLIHVFMGPLQDIEDGNFCVVPDDELVDRFVLTDETHDGKWLLNIEREDNAKLLTEYRGLEHIVG